MGLPLTTVIITLPSLSCRAAPLLSRYFFLRAFLQSHDPRGPAGLESLGVTHCAPSPQAQPGRQAARPDAQTVAVAGDVWVWGVALMERVALQSIISIIRGPIFI